MSLYHLGILAFAVALESLLITAAFTFASLLRMRDWAALGFIPIVAFGLLAVPYAAAILWNTPF